MSRLQVLALFAAFLVFCSDANPGVADDDKLRIICFGAHPDDAEYKSGGTAALWAKQGHHVKLVSVTNGDIGHWRMSGGALAKRRTAESVWWPSDWELSRKCWTFTMANCYRRWKTDVPSRG